MNPGDLVKRNHIIPHIDIMLWETVKCVYMTGQFPRNSIGLVLSIEREFIFLLVNDKIGWSIQLYYKEI